MTIAEALKYASVKLTAAGISNARLDAEVLLAYELGKDRAWIITHREDTLDSTRQPLFEDAIRRRSRREPLQYITGNQEFWGLDFKVTPAVLIPRPETELLVETAVEISKGKDPVALVDLCTGSGCIAVSLAKELADARIFATDMSGQALSVARENAQRHGVSDRIRFFEGNLFDPLDELDLRGRLDTITANPPYIPSGDLPALQPEVRIYEPELALAAGPSGTEVQKSIILTAGEYLKSRGVLIMEMGLGQAGSLKTAAVDTGSYGSIGILKDLAGIDRVIVARKK